MLSRHTSVGLVPVILLLLLLGTLPLFTGCGAGRGYEDVSMDVAWEEILDDYQDEDYLDASEQLEIFLINYAGSTLADSAQFLLAESHFEMKEYIIASSEYQKLITQYPRSPLVEEGEYKLGLSFAELSPSYQKDQEYTEKAIDTFQLFIEDFPSSILVPDAEEQIHELRDKLARKEYNAGRLYHKMSEYEAARVYYQSVLDNYYDSDYAVQAQLYKAESWADEKEWAEAIAAYRAFLTRYPDSKHSVYASNALADAEDEYEKSLREDDDEPGFWESLIGAED